MSREKSGKYQRISGNSGKIIINDKKVFQKIRITKKNEFRKFLVDPLTTLHSLIWGFLGNLVLLDLNFHGRLGTQ